MHPDNKLGTSIYKNYLKVLFRLVEPYFDQLFTIDVTKEVED